MNGVRLFRLVTAAGLFALAVPAAMQSDFATAAIGLAGSAVAVIFALGVEHASEGSRRPEQGSARELWAGRSLRVTPDALSEPAWGAPWIDAGTGLGVAVLALTLVIRAT